MNSEDFDTQFNFDFKDFKAFEEIDTGIFKGFDMDFDTEAGSKGAVGADFDFDFNFEMPEMPSFDAASFDSSSFKIEFPSFEVFPGFELEQKDIADEKKKAAAEAKRAEKAARDAGREAAWASRKEAAKSRRAARAARRAAAFAERQNAVQAKKAEIKEKLRTVYSDTKGFIAAKYESEKSVWDASWADLRHQAEINKENRLVDQRNKEQQLLHSKKIGVTAEGARPVESLQQNIPLFVENAQGKLQLAKEKISAAVSENINRETIEKGVSIVKDHAAAAYDSWAIVWDQLDEEKALKRADRITAQHNKEYRIQ